MRTHALGLSVEATVTATMTWDYRRSDARLTRLYEMGKRSVWHVADDIDWSSELEFGSPLPIDDNQRPSLGAMGYLPQELWTPFRWEYQSWMASQFLHGEQGALVATARLVETLPDIEAKFYAATQVTDEARHVDVYSRYLERLGQTYPINSSLRELMSNIIGENRWDMIYLGNQIIAEGLALAALRLSNMGFTDPVLSQITDLVARDESRHVAFGMVALDGFYQQLTSRELAEREEFVKEAILLMARRFMLAEIWDKLGCDVAAGTEFVATDPVMVQFRRLLFAKIVSSLGRLGLLTPGVRDHLDQLSLVRRPT